jgi:hypothetical protein
MPIYYGTLSIDANQSKLDLALLLMDGFPDPTQAMYQATQFLVNQKGLNDGDHLWVNGHGGAVGTVSTILMDDAGPIPADGPNLSMAVAGATPKEVAKTPAKARTNRRGAQ